MPMKDGDEECAAVTAVLESPGHLVNSVVVCGKESDAQ